MTPEIRESIDIAEQATVLAEEALTEAEGANPPDEDLIHAARSAARLARSVEQKAYENAANAALDTPGVRRLLEVLKTANAELKQVTDDLKATLKSLQAFARVANGVVGVLKAFA